MYLKRSLLYLITVSFFFASCKKEDAPVDPVKPPVVVVPSAAFPERFEYGTQATYTTADVTLATGKWNFADAMIGNTSSDHKSGTAAVRIQNTGSITMTFNAVTGASVISLRYAKYGTDTASSFQVWVSSNSGLGWIQEGNTITATTTTLEQAQIGVNYYGVVRLQIRKTGGGQLNLDDINILPNDPNPSKDDNMTMGNPSFALTDINSPDNYLIAKHQYAYSYNNSRGTANWVSWHLSSAWKGPQPRCDCFAPDNDIPSSFFRAQTTNYTSTGFDRGHMCPSDDRDLDYDDNSATFMMGNIMPQAPNLNQITWARLEDYCRTLMSSGYELYIISGGYGSGGTGSLGGTTTTFGGLITVPARFWKVIVVMQTGSNDAFRVFPGTRVIAVDMPNTQTASSQNWGNYRVSVDALENILGYDFLSNVNPQVQQQVEASVDNGPTQ